jgi:hypothetical protein
MATFSSHGECGSSLTCWNVRLIPSLRDLVRLALAIALPRKRTVPDVAGRTPEIQVEQGGFCLHRRADQGQDFASAHPSG